MTDQATILRDLVKAKQTSLEPILPEVPKRGTVQNIGLPSRRFRKGLTVAVTSGKGGVGKSNIALNLAIGLAEQKASVCLLDANIGLGNLDLLCGLNGYWNLTHVFTGARTLSEILIEGPAGVKIIPGASGLTKLSINRDQTTETVLQQLQELEQQFDFIIIDTAAGLASATRKMLSLTDLTLLVTTPEPTAIADTYAILKSLSTLEEPPVWSVLVNQSEAAQARRIIDRFQHTADSFLHTDVESSGFIPHDSHLPQAVVARQPLLHSFPQAPASDAFRKLARQIHHSTQVNSVRGQFFRKLFSAWLPAFV